MLVLVLIRTKKIVGNIIPTAMSFELRIDVAMDAINSIIQPSGSLTNMAAQ